MDAKFLAIFAVVAFFVGADAHYNHRRYYGHHRHHHRHNNNNNNNINRSNEGFYSWIRNLGNGRQTPENAYLRPGSSLVYAESSGDAVRLVNAQPARSFYDFSNAVPIAVLAPIGGPCYYRNTTLNLNTMVSTLGSINNTVIPSGTSIPMDGTAVRLTPEEVARLNQRYPALIDVCPGRDIIPTFPPGVLPPYSGPTGVLTVFSLDTTAVVTVPIPAVSNGFK